tara:strand:+ start:327 stop:497 length:171 start_codon:yes stop_codon:yes gene_type:complete
MKKKICVMLLASFMIFGSGCSTYNAIVPDWATIGSNQTDTTNKGTSSVWWNPFTWF